MNLNTQSRLNLNWQKIRITLAIAWLILTSSLAVWWMMFAMNLISQYESAITRHKAMLIWEGITLLGLLLIGGSTLIYFILQEKKHSESLRIFFSGFTHDIKNRLAGIKLQAESLRADNENSQLNMLVSRLITDTSRLQVQVENSLYVGGAKKLEVYYEDLDFKKMVTFLQDSWPQIKIQLQGEPILHTDRRTFENVVTNILHNSISHGQASEISVTAEKLNTDKVRLRFADNGQGFHGDIRRLGEIFYRHNPSSGSGLGLYTCRESLRRMQAQLSFAQNVKGENCKGFTLQIDLPGELQ